MATNLFCTFLILGSILYFLSSYMTDFLDDSYTITPILLATNRQLIGKAVNSNMDQVRTMLKGSEKSPLFRSIRMRYLEVFPSGEIAKLKETLSDGSKIDMERRMSSEDEA